jgi:hypothetical protein
MLETKLRQFEKAFGRNRKLPSKTTQLAFRFGAVFGRINLQHLKQVRIAFCLKRGNELRLELWMRVFKGLPHKFTPPFPVLVEKIVVSGISKIKNLARWAEHPKGILVV